MIRLKPFLYICVLKLFSELLADGHLLAFLTVFSDPASTHDLTSDLLKQGT